MKVAVCGLGGMGGAIAERLLELGHEVTVWNRSPERATRFAEKGAKVAASPAEAARAAEITISMLLDDAALSAVYEGPGGFLSADLSGTTIVEMSTVKPETTTRLGAAVKAAGGSFVECPVGGSTGPARQGKLLGLAGASAEDFAKAKPLLEQLCRRLEHVGPVGAGACMKLAVNLPLLVYYEAVGEALAFTRAAGIDPALATSIMADTSGTPTIGPMRLPWVLQAMQGNPPAEGGFKMTGVLKDVRLMNEVAQTLGFEVPVAAAARKSFEAAIAEGWGDRDGILVAAWRAMTARPRA